MEDVDFEEITKFPFVIYGAQVVAYGAYRAILGLYGRTPECFVVSRTEGNPVDIEGISVRTPASLHSGCIVLVCVTELLQDEIVGKLIQMGFDRIIKLTQKLEHQLMSQYYEKTGRFPVVRRADGKPKDMVLYEVKCHRDKTLCFHPKLKTFEISLQAGAALTNQRVAELTDDAGENISEKNKQYCEMSGTYWVWKNTKHSWKGIEHYRRHLLIEPEMITKELDAILPLPYMCYPNTISQFRRFVSEPVLQSLLKALKELHGDKYDDYCKILYGQYQYTYNLLFAKEEVFNDYCAWFFEITEYMETMSEDVPEIKNTRALSYVAEVLTNLYFMYHRELNIGHTEKAIYV